MTRIKKPMYSLNAIQRLATKGYSTDSEVLAFREDLILHERFQYGLDHMAERSQYAEQQSITVVIGPTGSGKTALSREFCFQFSEAIEALPINDRSTLLCMELAAPESGGFKWRDDFYVPALEALKEPCATKKINVQDLRDRLSVGNTRSAYGGRPRRIVDYRNDFYSALERGRVVTGIFDEANHLRRPTTKNGVFNQYDSLKSRSNACATHFILLGTTELADIFLQSGAISKRIFPIWLSPYDESEKHLFGAAVLSIIQKLPVKITFSVQAHLSELFRGSLGLVGLVHDWFDRALVDALSRGKQSITWADMQKFSLHPIQLAGIVREVVKYLELISNINVYFKEQMSILFMPKGVVAGAGTQTPSSTHSKSRRKPGERKPTRDEVVV